MAASSLPAERQQEPIVFYHEEIGVAALAELRGRYDFDEYVEKAKGEFERMTLLKRWTYETMTYGGAPSLIDLRNSLTLLEMAERGRVFWCNNIGAVYMQAALSMGWTARYVFVRNPLGESHILNDIWSNELRKWVMIDATWNIHIEKAGVPLSIPEIREEWRKNDGADLVYVYGAGDNERRFAKADLPIKRDDNFLYRLWPVTDKWIGFMQRVAVVGRNDFFSIGDGSGSQIWGLIYTLAPSDPSERVPAWEYDRYPKLSASYLFHALNEVSIALLTVQGEAGAYELALDAFKNGSYAPNFQRYEYRLDGGVWIQSTGKARIKAAPGALIEARIRNKFGVAGPISGKRVE